MFFGRVTHTNAAGLALASLLLVGAGSGLAQTTDVPRPGPVESTPLPPPGGPAPASPAPASPAPAAPAPVSSAPFSGAGARATLVEKPGDPSDVDQITLTAKPVAILSGTSSWDDAFATLKKAYQRLEGELGKAGIAATGRPITLFVQSDDDKFRFDAMVPVERAPDSRPPIAADIRFGTTPAGAALRFVHKGAYEDIESTYETITAYVDAKDLVVQDAFMEEYVSGLTEASDADLEVNIFALLKDAAPPR